MKQEMPIIHFHSYHTPTFSLAPFLKQPCYSGCEATAFNPDRFGIFTVRKSTLLIGDLNSGEGFGSQNGCTWVHDNDHRIADIGEVLE